MCGVCAAAVFDVSRMQTLEHLESQWLEELERYGTEECAVRMVVANKVDVVSAAAAAAAG